MCGIRYAWAMVAFALCGMVATAGWAEVSTTGDTKDDGSVFYAGYNANTTGGLTIDAGSVFNRSGGNLGYATGSTGTATITGAGSWWANLGGLSVGWDGSGTVRAEAGGLITSGEGRLGFHSGSTGTAVVTGAGSKWLCSGSFFYVGYAGSGALRVEAGGEVRDGNGYIGYLGGSSGNATVTGAGSQWINSNVYVGYAGSGTLNVEDGGEVSDMDGYIGSSGKVTVTGAGSKWINSDELQIGYNGGGTLTVSDGGLVSTRRLYASLSDLYGDGTITTSGGVVDADLSFDAAHGLTQMLSFGSGGTLQFTVDGNSELGVGFKQSGSLRIAEGRSITSLVGYLGRYSGSTGTAVITGAGSNWTSSGDLYVGRYGSGTLTVSDGGSVSAQTLYGSLGDLHGDGTITTSGAVLDGDLIFDAANGAAQTVTFGTGGTLQLTTDSTSVLGVGYKQAGSLRIAGGRSVASANGYLGYDSGSTGTAIITGVGSTWTNSGSYFYVGYNGSGTLRVEAGGQVKNRYGYLGYRSNSTGEAIVTGAGSKWTNSGLCIGYIGSGTLRVEAGGEVSSSSAHLGWNFGSMGTAIITGTGSKWTSLGELDVGWDGSGMLTVSDGGQVTAKSLSINNQSAVHLHVSGDRMLVLGDTWTVGSVSNAGKLSLLADAFLPGGTYRPIGEYADRSLSWTGSGSTLAVGGVWDSNAGTFTVSAPTVVDAGMAAEVAGGMRVVIRDVASGERVGVSFGTLNSGNRLMALPLSENERAALALMLDAKEVMLSGWEFEGELAGGEAMVSLEVGLGAPEVRLWRLSQNGWSRYTPEMMTYDSKGIVSFTVDPASLNSGGYAVTNPEPGGLGLLAVAAGMLLGRRRGARAKWSRRG